MLVEGGDGESSFTLNYQHYTVYYEDNNVVKAIGVYSFRRYTSFNANVS